MEIMVVVNQSAQQASLKAFHLLDLAFFLFVLFFLLLILFLLLFIFYSSFPTKRLFCNNSTTFFNFLRKLSSSCA